jgi:hypothetical protein
MKNTPEECISFRRFHDFMGFPLNTGNAEESSSSFLAGRFSRVSFRTAP